MYSIVPTTGIQIRTPPRPLPAQKNLQLWLKSCLLQSLFGACLRKHVRIMDFTCYAIKKQPAWSGRGEGLFGVGEGKGGGGRVGPMSLYRSWDWEKWGGGGKIFWSRFNCTQKRQNTVKLVLFYLFKCGKYNLSLCIKTELATRLEQMQRLYVQKPVTNIPLHRLQPS